MKLNWQTSGFGDEADATLSGQIAAITRAGLKGLDVRNVDGVNVLDLTDSQLEEVRKQCADAGVRVQTVGSPINKVHLGPETLGNEMEKLRRAIHAAHQMGTTRIRLFTPETAVPATAEERAGVFEVVSAMVTLAKSEGILLLHENDARYYGAYPSHAVGLMKEFGGANFKFAFDFANTVLLGFRTWDDWFPWVLPYLDTVHMKDARASESKVVPCGEGDGQILRTLTFLASEQWEGALTLEPHLQAAGPMSGYSGPELFQTAATAMTGLIGQALV